MLENGLKTKLHSYISSLTAVNSLSTTFSDSGVFLSLSPNTEYEITATLIGISNDDGIKFRLTYSGTLSEDTLSMMLISNGPTYSRETWTIASSAQEATLNVDLSVHASGIIKTGSAGILKLQFARVTDVNATAATLSGGTFLSARPL